MHSSFKSESLIDSELEAIMCLDIPLFNANTSGLQLWAGGKTVAEDYFKTMPYQTIVKRILALDIQDTDRQKTIILSALKERYRVD